MSVRIRKAVEDDFPSILSLIKELAEFERASDKVTNSLDQMRMEKGYFHCYVAETADKEIIGIALYYFVYYTWVGKSLYLEDIFVKNTFRGMNTGTALLEKIFETAKLEDCKRIRWQVLKWNKSAIELYKKAGACVDDDWYNCTVDEAGINNFLTR